MASTDQGRDLKEQGDGLSWLHIKQAMSGFKREYWSPIMKVRWLSGVFLIILLR